MTRRPRRATDRPGSTSVLDRAGLDALIAVLHRRRLPRDRADRARQRDRARPSSNPAPRCPPDGASRPGPGTTGCAAASDAAVFAHSAGRAVVEAVPAPAAAAAVVGDADGFTAAVEEPVQLRVPRRARLRPRRDRHARHGAGRRRAPRRRIHPAPRRACSSSRRTAPSRAASASARRWAPAPRPDPGYDLSPHRADRRRRATGSSSTSAPDEGARVLAAAHPPRRRRTRGRPTRAPPSTPPPTAWAARCPSATSATLLQ